MTKQEQARPTAEEVAAARRLASANDHDMLTAPSWKPLARAVLRLAGGEEDLAPHGYFDSLGEALKVAPKLPDDGLDSEDVFAPIAPAESEPADDADGQTARSALVRLGHVLLGCDGNPCRVECDPVGFADDMVRRANELTGRELEWCDTVAAQRPSAEPAEGHEAPSYLLPQPGTEAALADAMRAGARLADGPPAKGQGVDAEALAEEIAAAGHRGWPNAIRALAEERDRAAHHLRVAGDQAIRERTAREQAEREVERLRGIASEMVEVICGWVERHLDAMPAEVAVEADRLRAALAQQEAPYQ